MLWQILQVAFLTHPLVSLDHLVNRRREAYSINTILSSVLDIETISDDATCTLKQLIEYFCKLSFQSFLEFAIIRLELGRQQIQELNEPRHRVRMLTILIKLQEFLHISVQLFILLSSLARSIL